MILALTYEACYSLKEKIVSKNTFCVHHWIDIFDKLVTLPWNKFYFLWVICICANNQRAKIIKYQPYLKTPHHYSHADVSLRRIQSPLDAVYFRPCVVYYDEEWNDDTFL